MQVEGLGGRVGAVDDGRSGEGGEGLRVSGEVAEEVGGGEEYGGVAGVRGGRGGDAPGAGVAGDRGEGVVGEVGFEEEAGAVRGVAVGGGDWGGWDAGVSILDSRSPDLKVAVLLKSVAEEWKCSPLSVMSSSTSSRLCE